MSAPRTLAPGWPAWLAFASSAAVLVAELAAPRLLAPSVGTSVMAWAASITTFLGGLALGSLWGGRLADRHGLRPLLPLALGAGLLLALAPLLHAALQGPLAALAPSPALAALLVTPACFLAPAMLLGTLGPLLTREALRESTSPGRVLGGLAAAGSVGAGVGVFAGGYLLLPRLEVGTVLGVAGLLCSLPALPLAWRARRAAATAPRPAQPVARHPTPSQDTEASPAPGGGLTSRRLAWLAALSGFAFLSLEMAAGRIAVLGLGNSLYTWTAVLGVMLVGSAVGAALGGRLADRLASQASPRQGLAQGLAWCALGVGMCLWTPLLMARVLHPALPWGLQCVLAAAVGFLPAALALGALGPPLTRAALADPAHHGRVVGRMQALGTLGAVVGALATPLALLPWLGSTALVALLCFELSRSSDRVAGRASLLALRAVLVAVAVLAMAPAGSGSVLDTLAGVGRLLRLREDTPDVHVRESAYYRIRVDPEPGRWCWLATPPDVAALEADPRLAGKVAWSPERQRLSWLGPPLAGADYAALVEHVAEPRDQAAVARLALRTHHVVRQLGLDKLTHGFADLSDPTWLGYDYEIVAAAVWRQVAPARGQRAFFVGGGPYTFQRRVLALDPEAALVTAEIDPAVTDTARTHLGLADSPRHVILHQDARLALPARPAGERYDVVFGDAFNDFSVPFHLTTLEFARSVRERLAPGGAYLVNVVDAWRHGAFLAAMHRTLSEAFPHVHVLSLGPRHDHQRETFLLVASTADHPLERLVDDLERPLPIIRYSPAELAALHARTQAPLLTDALAPVDVLLAPLARDAGSGAP